MQDDSLEDFTKRAFTLEGVTKTVYVSGKGPAVIQMPEMPGITPHVARFARWVREAGFTVYLPSLYGRDGAYPDTAHSVAVFKKTCVSAEFRAFAANEASPVTQWLRALARQAHEECGGPGVGAIGMCFTGNFALSMMLEPAVLAPVLCQPSLPLDQPARLESNEAELAAVRKRMANEKLTALAYRFDGDRFCTAERFAAYAAALGDRFRPRVLPAESGNPNPPPFYRDAVGCAHSVVTAHLVDEAGHPTVAARDEILEFFRSRLQA